MSEPRNPEVERERATPKVLPRDETSTSWRRFGAPRAAQPGASRRRDPRVPAPFEVSTSTIDPVTDGITGQTCFHASDDGVVNLSRRGACLISDTPPSVGTRLLVQLRVPGQTLSIDLMARTRWTRIEFKPGKIGARPICLFGVEIMGGTPAALDRLEDALAGLGAAENASVAGPEGLR